MSGASGVAGFIGVRPGDRHVHQGSLGAFWCALGVVAIISGRCVHWGAALGVVVFNRDAPCGSSGSSGVFGVHPGGRWVFCGDLSESSGLPEAAR